MSRSSQPNEKRVLERVPTYRGEKITLRGYGQDGKLLIAQILEMNSFGLTAEYNSDIISNRWIGTNVMLKDIEITFKDKIVARYPRGKIMHFGQYGGRTKIGIWLDACSAAESPRKLRKVPRLLIATEFAPFALFQHPFQYQNQVHLSLTNLSRGGARGVCSLRNRLLLVGSEIKKLNVYFPTVGESPLAAQVTYVNYLQELGKLAVGLKFTQVGSEFDDQVSRYFFRFGNETGLRGPTRMGQLTQAGFRPKFVRSHIEYAYVSAVDQYTEVLKIRAKAYGQEGKKEVQVITDMADIQDLHSRIVLARAGKETVGSVRITFCNQDRERFELEDSLRLPARCERKKTMEVSRLCVDPFYRRTDLVLGLIERTIQLAIQENIEWTITSCTKDRIRYYGKMGFRVHRRPFFLKAMPGIPHYLLVLDVKKVVAGRGKNALAWHFTYAPVLRFLQRFGFYPGSRENLWHRLAGRLVRPLMALHHRRRQRRRAIEQANDTSTQTKDPPPPSQAA